MVSSRKRASSFRGRAHRFGLCGTSRIFDAIRLTLGLLSTGLITQYWLTLPFVGISEAEGVALANENVSRMSTMSADEASHWDELHMGYHVDRVNHSEIYSDHGKHTNMVESYFSRLRRMVQGRITT